MTAQVSQAAAFETEIRAWLRQAVGAMDGLVFDPDAKGALRLLKKACELVEDFDAAGTEITARTSLFFSQSSLKNLAASLISNVRRIFGFCEPIFLKKSINCLESNKDRPAPNKLSPSCLKNNSLPSS